MKFSQFFHDTWTAYHCLPLAKIVIIVFIQLHPHTTAGSSKKICLRQRFLFYRRTVLHQSQSFSLSMIHRIYPHPSEYIYFCIEINHLPWIFLTVPQLTFSDEFDKVPPVIKPTPDTNFPPNFRMLISVDKLFSFLSIYNLFIALFVVSCRSEGPLISISTERNRKMKLVSLDDEKMILQNWSATIYRIHNLAIYRQNFPDIYLGTY